MLLGDSGEGLDSPAVGHEDEIEEDNDNKEEQDAPEDGEEEEEELMLRQAIALSLERAEEDYQWGKLLNFETLSQ